MYDLDMTYFDFVEERHRIWEKRQAGDPGPWSTDPILATRKFTNVYRVLDRGSQFLLRMLREPSLDYMNDVFFRCFLYRYTNLPETWEEAYRELGRWPEYRDVERLRKIWKARRARGERLFSGAYMIVAQPGQQGDKLDHVLDLTRHVCRNVRRKFIAADTLRDRLEILREPWGLGDFTSMQICTDWGYSPFGTDEENDFVAPGPGARRGIRVWGWEGDYLEGMKHARDYWHSERSVLLAGRPPSLMDVQNTFCEFFKYDRYRNSKKPVGDSNYRSGLPAMPPVMLPVHWQLATNPERN
jgi:hypothetical protein